jgi:hypothetical protein
MTGLGQYRPNATFGQMAGDAASGCPTPSLHRVGTGTRAALKHTAAL